MPSLPTAPSIPDTARHAPLLLLVPELTSGSSRRRVASHLRTPAWSVAGFIREGAVLHLINRIALRNYHTISPPDLVLLAMVKLLDCTRPTLRRADHTATFTPLTTGTVDSVEKSSSKPTPPLSWAKIGKRESQCPRAGLAPSRFQYRRFSAPRDFLPGLQERAPAFASLPSLGVGLNGATRDRSRPFLPGRGLPSNSARWPSKNFHHAHLVSLSPRLQSHLQPTSTPFTLFVFIVLSLF